MLLNPALLDPEIGRSLAGLDMLREVQVRDGNSVAVTVELPTPAYPRRERISQSIGAVLAAKLPAGTSMLTSSSACRSSPG